MNNNELRKCMNQLAEKLEFRWIEKTKRFIGIHRRVIVELSEWDGVVIFQFTSPTVDLAKEVKEDFEGFTHCEEGGLPTHWFTYLTQTDDNGNEHYSDHGCAVSINGKQIDDLGVETFDQIPDLVVDDFYEHGASDRLICCNCDEKEATTVVFLEYAQTPMCDDCWQELQFHASSGKLATEQTVNWLQVAPALLALTALGGWGWGYLQQTGEVDGLILYVLPVIWSNVLCWSIWKICSGVTRMLRMSLFASVVVSVTIGNIWGFRTAAIKEIEKQFDQPFDGPGWMETVQWYCETFPEIWQSEVLFYMGGVFGACLGLRLLKSAETIDVQ